MEDDALESLKVRLNRMRERREAMMSPETRRLKEAYEESFKRDQAEPYAWMDEADASPAADMDDMDVIGSSDEMKKRLPGWREEEPEGEEDGPKVRRLKDEGW